MRTRRSAITRVILTVAAVVATTALACASAEDLALVETKVPIGVVLGRPVHLGMSTLALKRAVPDLRIDSGDRSVRTDSVAAMFDFEDPAAWVFPGQLTAVRIWPVDGAAPEALEARFAGTAAAWTSWAGSSPRSRTGPDRAGRIDTLVLTWDVGDVELVLHGSIPRDVAGSRPRFRFAEVANRADGQSQ